MVRKKRSFGGSVRRFLFMVIGGLLGLALAAFLLLGPLNGKPQIPFDQATGFAALFFTAVLGYTGVVLGGWVADDADVVVEKPATPDPNNGAAAH